MKTQIVVYALQTLILAAVHLAEAQQQQSGKVLRIGYLSGPSRSSMSPRTEAFRQGLWKAQRGKHEENNHSPYPFRYALFALRFS